MKDYLSLFFKYNRNLKSKTFRIKLKGGLGNKLHCLFSACDIALRQNARIVEPFFGWKEKIKFSTIYDIGNFNTEMSKYNHGKSLMVPDNIWNWGALKLKTDLWEYSEEQLSLEREAQKIDLLSTKIKVLQALRLREEWLEIVEKHAMKAPFTAIQVRNESDWVEHAKRFKPLPGERILVDINALRLMLEGFPIKEKLFFTTGEDHACVAKSLKQLNFECGYFYDPTLEYEINAAINFEICCRATDFIGNSRSSFSNLISLKRAVLLQDKDNYIYNFQSRILPRVDKGLQFEGEKSVTLATTIN